MPEISKQMQRRIRERWEELRPELTIHARIHRGDPIEALAEWVHIHARRIEMMLLAGLKLRKIRQYNLDDPRIEFNDFMWGMNKAISNQRHRRRAPPSGLAKFLTSDHTTQGEHTSDHRTGIRD